MKVRKKNSGLTFNSAVRVGTSAFGTLSKYFDHGGAVFVPIFNLHQWFKLTTNIEVLRWVVVGQKCRQDLIFEWIIVTWVIKQGCDHSKLSFFTTFQTFQQSNKKGWLYFAELAIIIFFVDCNALKWLKDITSVLIHLQTGCDFVQCTGTLSIMLWCRLH